MDGSVERGYVGKLIFFLYGRIKCIYKCIGDYVRFFVLIGINGVVINNVNVRDKVIWLIILKYLNDFLKIVEIF